MSLCDKIPGCVLDEGHSGFHITPDKTAELRAQLNSALSSAAEHKRQLEEVRAENEALAGDVERWKAFQAQEEGYANDLLVERDKLIEERDQAREERDRHAAGAELYRATIEAIKVVLGLAGGGIGLPLERHVAELKAEVESLKMSFSDLGDDICGLQPVGTPDDAIKAISQRDFERRAEIERLRPVYEAAHRWAAFGRDGNEDEYALLCAVRVSKAESLDELSRLTQEFTTEKAK